MRKVLTMHELQLMEEAIAEQGKNVIVIGCDELNTTTARRLLNVLRRIEDEQDGVDVAVFNPDELDGFIPRPIIETIEGIFQIEKTAPYQPQTYMDQQENMDLLIDFVNAQKQFRFRAEQIREAGGTVEMFNNSNILLDLIFGEENRNVLLQLIDIRELSSDMIVECFMEYLYAEV